MSKRLTGVIPPMTTPFDRDGELVLKEVAAQVEWPQVPGGLEAQERWRRGVEVRPEHGRLAVQAGRAERAPATGVEAA